MRKSAKFLLGGAGVVVAAVAAIGGYIYWTKAISPRLVVRPADSKPFAGAPAKLLEIGMARHGDESLSPIGRSCNTCHLEENSYNKTFNRPFPHYVQSVRLKTGLDQITAEGMVQFCMISAMEGRPLGWDSEALAALTAFVLERNRKAIGAQPAQSSMMNDSCSEPEPQMTPTPHAPPGLRAASR